MAIIKAKGYEFNTVDVKSAFNRRVVQFGQNIINNLKKIGLTENDIDVPLEPNGIRKAAASASWYVDGYFLYYSYDKCSKYVENLYVVSKVIELEVNALLDGKKTGEEFIHDFTEDSDIEEKRKEARKFLGLNHDVMDMDLINKKYKEMAKELHPDMPTGSTEKFKELNNAHKMLKRELE